MQITVCIPTYNRAEFITTALDSAFDQEFFSYKILIYDDGSTDGTPEVIRHYLDNERSAYDRQKVTFVEDPTNRGNGYVRKWFRDNANTEAMTWLDSDDWMSPQRLQRQYLQLRNAKADVCYSYLMPFTGEDPLKTRTVRKIDLDRWSVQVESLYDNMVTGTALFTKEVAAHIPDVEINCGGWDIVWTFSIIAAGFKTTMCHRPLYHLRKHPGRITELKKTSEWAECREKEKGLIRKCLLDLGIAGITEELLWWE